MSGDDVHEGERTGFTPHHCPTCKCEPVGPLPRGVVVDPYCPEHGTEPTAYSACSCRTRVALPPGSGGA